MSKNAKQAQGTGNKAQQPWAEGKDTDKTAAAQAQESTDTGNAGDNEPTPPAEPPQAGENGCVRMYNAEQDKYADVHPDEVASWSRYGWGIVETGEAE